MTGLLCKIGPKVFRISTLMFALICLFAVMLISCKSGPVANVTPSKKSSKAHISKGLKSASGNRKHATTGVVSTSAKSKEHKKTKNKVRKNSAKRERKRLNPNKPWF
jgi:F0F1-type ATP synthase membrane subunit b/b'